MEVDNGIYSSQKQRYPGQSFGKARGRSGREMQILWREDNQAELEGTYRAKKMRGRNGDPAQKPMLM